MKEEVIDEQSRKIPNPDVREMPFSEQERVHEGITGLIKDIVKIRAEAKAKEVHQDSKDSQD